MMTVILTSSAFLTFQLLSAALAEHLSPAYIEWCDKVAGRDEMREMSDVIIINEVRCDTSFQYICRQWRHYNFKKHAIILIFFYLEPSS